MEAMYKSMAGDNIVFPREYPTGCLLGQWLIGFCVTLAQLADKINRLASLTGFVDVEDVVPQEEYRARYPNGESGSPFVFLCTNPHELIVKYPMKVC